jgi:hypothetical protein
MKPKYIFLLILLSLSIFSFAQKKASAYNFHSINSLSFLNGDNEVSAGLQSVNGFQKKNLFVGVGVGLDYYIHRSVPLFGDVRYEFGKGKNKFFAYADAGVNFQWVEDPYFNDGPIFIWDGGINTTTRDFDNGVYTDAGVGYIVGMKKGGGLVLSLGHTRKTLKATDTYQDWRTQEWFTDIYHYKLNRIAVKVGWRF